MKLVLMQNSAVLKWKSKITVILSSDIQNPSDVYEKFKQKLKIKSLRYENFSSIQTRQRYYFEM